MRRTASLVSLLLLPSVVVSFNAVPLAAVRSVPASGRPPALRVAATAKVTMVAAPTEAAAPLLAFADQSGNLAGALFPASLPSYALFLYFICQDVNGLSTTAKASFTSLLAFVFATVVSSIVAVKSFGLNLANVDWLHSEAEQLLSFTNIANCIGLKLTLDAYAAAPPGTVPATEPGASSLWGSPVLKVIGGAAAATVALTWAAAGGELGAHTAYLGGIGNLPEGAWTFGAFAEPDNALSIPTWTIHVASLLEWLVAMGLVWRIGTVSGNPRWKGLTWAMIPSHSSGVVACVYHFFYNAESLQFLVTLQAALTLLGNTTLAFAAWRLAVSNGWQFALPTFAPPGDAAVAGAAPSPPAATTTAAATGASDAAVNAAGGGLGGLVTIFAWSVVLSYVIKYGETLLPFIPDADSLTVPAAAVGMVVAATGFNCWKWQQRSGTSEADCARLTAAGRGRRILRSCQRPAPASPPAIPPAGCTHSLTPMPKSTSQVAPPMVSLRSEGPPLARPLAPSALCGLSAALARHAARSARHLSHAPHACLVPIACPASTVGGLI